jgi:hypothetical protein
MLNGSGRRILWLSRRDKGTPEDTPNAWARTDRRHGGNSGGEGGIRTHGTVSRTLAFEASTFNRSVTSPRLFLILTDGLLSRQCAAASCATRWSAGGLLLPHFPSPKSPKRVPHASALRCWLGLWKKRAVRVTAVRQRTLESTQRIHLKARPRRPRPDDSAADARESRSTIEPRRPWDRRSHIPAAAPELE